MSKDALKPLAGLVEYRRTDQVRWSTMAAFDSLSMAEKYAERCGSDNSEDWPWEYRAVEAEKARTLGAVMAALYASEINCGMASFWDAGFAVWLGDDLNGRAAEEQFAHEDFDEIAEWLHAEAVRLYPGSEYAKQAAAHAALPEAEG
ncbi:MAG: hypothetical protein Q8R02_23315 [Hyphomonadaceae bacterium]|nr:hypothetical protein [Hyphomonadaceae bacterium]